MPKDGAVTTLEAPAADAGLDQGSSTDTSTDNSGSSDGGTTDAIDTADTPQSGESGHLRGAELYRSVKDKLKSAGLSPQQLRSVRNAVWMADKAEKATGGDLSAFEKTQQIVSKLADNPEDGYTPEQLIEQTIQERTFWREFDTKFEKGDRTIIADMISANPESFQALAPAAMDEFARINPEGFSAYVAKSATGYLNGKQIPLQFAILDTFLPSMPDFPGKERLVAAIQAIYGAFEGLDKMAQGQIAPKKGEGQPQQAGGIDQREERISAKEMDLTRREWNADSGLKGGTLRDAEMNRIAATQKVTLDDADRAKIKAAVGEEFNARLAANARYGQAMRGFLQAGNRRSYIERVNSEAAKMVPGITARHTQAVIDAKKAAGAAKASASGAKPVSAKSGNAQPSNGSNGNLVQWLSAHPKTLGKMIDHARTSYSMLQRNEAYLMGENNLFKWKARAV
jgi:hypothetical protein